MKSISLHDREVVQPQVPEPAVPSGIHFPHEILSRADLSRRAKREILSAWASDANAVDSMPTLRHLPGTPFPVLYSSIMDARERLDRSEFARDAYRAAKTRKSAGGRTALD
jgi:hypothetical protein